MTTATEDRIRACLVREGVCEDEAAQRLAAVIAEEIETGDATKVGQDQFEARLAQIDARIALLGREFAERDARQAREMRVFIASMQEIERQRDERERQRDERERERDERERERDEREREREAKWEQRYERFQRVVYAALGAGITALGILIAVLGLVA